MGKWPTSSTLLVGMILSFGSLNLPLEGLSASCQLASSPWFYAFGALSISICLEIIEVLAEGFTVGLLGLFAGSLPQST
jgi:hypothetical protein